MRKLFTLFALFYLSGLLLHSQAQTYTIYPTPQKIVEGDGSIELSNTINVICESSIGEVSRNRMKEVLENAGYSIAYADEASQTLTNLYIGTSGSNGVAARYAADNNLPLTVLSRATTSSTPICSKSTTCTRMATSSFWATTKARSIMPLPRSNKFSSKPTATRSVKLLLKTMPTHNIGES